MINKIVILIAIVGNFYPQYIASQIKTSDFYTANLRVNDSWELPPVIRLNSSDKITLSFDELNQENQWYSYALIHCNADGSESQMSESEYLNGFNNQQIDDYQYSFNTLIPYTNYRVTLPNEQMQIRLSGNYRLEIYRDNNRSQAVLSAQFSVTEELIPTRTTIKTITDIDYRDKHQQLEILLNTKNYEIRNPSAEIKVRVRQNYREDNQIWVSTPLYSNPNEIVFASNRSLIFKAGNEFRKFEITTHKYNGIGTENTKYFEPYYHTTLEINKDRSSRPYYYDQDQDGRYIIRTLDADEQQSETEAQYHVVHFTLNPEQILPKGDIYILGEFSGYRLDERCKMQYSIERNQYEASLLLKQGHYNFMYLHLPHGEKSANTLTIEGDFHETQNCYLIEIFHRPMGYRYDRLISTTIIR
ncbi:MAG: DUF5103 domain-containing protein [Bacteroidales bacterium]